MGKKGGKKKGKGGKGKKAAKGENEMTLKEAMLAFQIQIKEKSAEELRFEIAGLKEKNKRYQKRNENLKDEQLLHIKTLLRQAKEQEKELEQQEVYNSEHVEQGLRGKWDAARVEEGDLDDFRLKIATVNEQYSALNAKVEYWSTYRDSGSHEHKQLIELLERELDDMKKNFNDMCSHLKWQLDNAKSEVKAHTEHCMTEQTFLASEKAMEQLDSASFQEVHENEWLKHEAMVHRNDEKELLATLDKLESDNLEIISNLLECRQEDLKISRRVYLTQFTEDEILNNDTMHDMDLKQMSVYQRGAETPPGIPAIEDRPKSAMLQAVENKVFSIMAPEDLDEEEESEDEVDENMEAEMIARQGEDINIEDDKDFLHLGPLEIKLLCVSGEKKPIYPMDAGLEIKDGTKADITVTRPRWPIQTPMIRAALENSGGVVAASGAVKIE